MKQRDLFNIIIKVFGLFIIKDILATFPYLISSIVFLTTGEMFKDGLVTLVLSVVVLGIYFSVAYMLLFKTDSILDFLKLEPEFMDDRLTFNISAKAVITIALIILSGYILIDEIPNFCKYLFMYYEQAQVRFTTARPSISNLIVSGIKILLAFLMIGERKRIIQFINKEEAAKQENDQEP